jgi:hypothetical protein
MTPRRKQQLAAVEPHAATDLTTVRLLAAFETLNKVDLSKADLREGERKRLPVSATVGPASLVLQISILLPGARYGGIANATLHELRVGDWALNNVEVQIFDRWRYAFGEDETPLLGLPALQQRGVRLEIEGNTCRLTLPATRTAAR